MSYNIRSKQIITRKSHRCFGCGRLFQRGTSMECSAIVDDGIFNCYLCESCQKVVQDRAREYGDFTYVFGELREDTLEYEEENSHDET